MRIFKKQVNVGQYRIGALWGNYEPRFMDFLDSLCLVIPSLDDDERDDLMLQLEDIVGNFASALPMSSGDCDAC